MKHLKYYFFILAGTLYLLNPTAGLWEIIPDNIPIIGNLDEVAAVLLVIKSWKELKKNSPSKSAP